MCTLRDIVAIFGLFNEVLSPTFLVVANAATSAQARVVLHALIVKSVANGSQTTSCCSALVHCTSTSSRSRASWVRLVVRTSSSDESTNTHSIKEVNEAGRPNRRAASTLTMATELSVPLSTFFERVGDGAIFNVHPFSRSPTSSLRFPSRPQRRRQISR